MKTCNVCSIEKEAQHFNKDTRNKDGLRGECRECAAEKNRVWRANNPKRYREQRANYYGSDVCRVTGRNREQRRRARKRNNGTFLVTIQDIQRLMAQPCFACGSRENLTVDHIVPIARGGKHAVGNLMTLCGSCNSSKGSMLWTEWRFSNTPRALDVFADRQEAGK